MLYTFIYPMLLYNCEIWTFTKKLEKSLDIFQRKLLRRMQLTDKIRNKEIHKRSHQTSIKLKKRTLNTFIYPILLYNCEIWTLKGLSHPAFLARVVSWFPFVVAIFMGHENGGKQRLAKRRHVQGMLDETDPLTKKLEESLDIFQRKLLRRMLHIKLTDKIRNEEIYKRSHQTSIKLKKRTLNTFIYPMLLYNCEIWTLKGLSHPAFLARVVSRFPFVVAIFMGHENGGKQRLAKRRHVQGMLDETDPLTKKLEESLDIFQRKRLRRMLHIKLTDTRRNEEMKTSFQRTIEKSER